MLACFIIGSTIFFFSLHRVKADSTDVDRNLQADAWIQEINNNSSYSQIEKQKKIQVIKDSLKYDSDKPSTIMIWVTTAIGWLLAGASMFLGYVLTVILTVLINVASFNNIIDVPAVVTGWVIVRDLCNMFFVLILLVIAFSTILRRENYSLKKALPKLIIAAVLINFSRTIFGLITDFSQVIMMTFVSSFAVFGGNNLVEIFQVSKSWTISTKQIDAMGSMNIFLGIVAGTIAMIIS